MPVYVAAATSRVVEQAAELADGIMPIFWSPERVAQTRVWAARGRARKASPERGPLDVTLGIPTFIGDDPVALREAARHNLVLYTFFAFFQHLFRASGFAEEADQMEQGAGVGSLSDRLLDALCLIGPIERCRDRLAAYRTAGVDLPILMPPIGVDGPWCYPGVPARHGIGRSEPRRAGAEQGLSDPCCSSAPEPTAPGADRDGVGGEH